IYANPATIVWSKPTGTIFRGYSTPNLSQGRWYMFFVVDRAWLHNKYIRWRWQGNYSYSFATQAEIWDGEYDRSSMVDFPDQAGPISKGNGTLQVLDLNSGSFAMETKDVQADTSGGSEEKCTVIFWSHDSWSGQQGYFQLDWIEINTGAGGAGMLNTEDFTGNIVPEQTGTNNDYGYIGEGPVDPIITRDLPAKFESGQNNQSLPGKFISRQSGSAKLLGEFIVRQGASTDLPAGFRLRQDVEDLPASFTAAQWQADLPGEVIIRHTNTENLPGSFSIRRTATSDIPGEFIPRHADSEDLPGEFVARHSASVELHGAFDGQVSENLLGIFSARRDASVELLGTFSARRDGSEELLGEFVIRQWRANLLGIFSVRQAGSVELSGAAIVRHAASTDLRMSFWVQFYSVDLPASLYIRPAGSRATDFQVKDRTRGLTIHDVDREMTVTPRRKMRVR
ncbi:MAG: hypothetical protein KAX31_07555, partial [Thermoplasmata archaeon]|nr:hypothetical protein [Thermoplasmata archaeon]